MEFIINPPISSEAITLFGFNIKWYGIFIASSIFVALFVGYRLLLSKYSKDDAETFLDSVFPTVFFSIFGARLFYVIGEINFYEKYPNEIILINHGGLSIFGAIIFGILTLYLFFKFKNLNPFKFLDVYGVIMPLAQAIGRFGNYFNQEAYGAPTNGIIKLFVDEVHRKQDFIDISYYHPTFLYESILNIILFLILLILFIFNKNIKKGTFFALYLIFYSIIRIIVEGYRIDSVMYILNIPIAQIISFFVLILGIVILFKVNKKTPSK